MPESTNEFDANVARELRRRVRAFGAKFDHGVLTQTRDLYREHIALPVADERRDISYGPDPRHMLDLYRPDTQSLGTVVFVHGGGFVGGDKNEDGTFYQNVGRFLADAGFTAVLINYRRAPQHVWPAAALDVRDAVDWVRQSDVGTSGAPLFVWGQSAGAAHVATWFFDDSARAAPLGRVAGVLLMSGFYHPSAPMSDNAAAYFGRDASNYEQRSAMLQAKPSEVPIWISVAEFDPGVFAARGFELAQRLSLLCGRAPEFAWLQGHNHVSTVMSLGSPQTDSGDAVLRFLTGCLKLETRQ